MARKGGLGKGLDALIPGGEDFQGLADGVKLIPIEKISPNPHQPRDTILDEDIKDLAASIREHGVLQPLILSYDPIADSYVLIAGERRLRASRLAGLEMVPATLRQVGSNQERLELALIENIQREDLSPLETAEAYRQLSETFHLSHEDIAERVCKSRVSVTNTLRLLNLPEKVRNALADGNITEGHARTLLGLPNQQAQIAALGTILKLGLSVRQAEELIRKMGGEKPAPTPKKIASPEIRELEHQLRNSLGTKVTLNHTKHGGTLIIHYYSQEELDSIIHQILK